MSLPPPFRSRLAGLIPESLHDARARAGLEALAAVGGGLRTLEAVREVPEAFRGEFFRLECGASLPREGVRRTIRRRLARGLL